MSRVSGAAARRREPEVFGGRRIAAFGETLVVGLAVTALALPLVTAAPALAAGARHLTNHVEGRSDTVGSLFRDGWRAIRTGWLFGLASAAVVGVLLLNVALGLAGLVPGGQALAIVSALLAAGVAVCVCRTAALWSPVADWRALWHQGRTLVITDPVGSAYVLSGLLVAAVVVWMLPPLVVISPGVLVVAMVSAERRRAEPTQRASRPSAGGSSSGR